MGKTLIKISNVIGHQPDLSTNGKVCASCLLLDRVSGLCMRHVSVIGQHSGTV